MRARADALERQALPVREVVADLVPGPRPVRDLVAAVAGRGEAVLGERVLLGSAVLVLTGASTLAPAPRAAGRREVVAARSALGVRIVERQRVQREVVRLEREGGVDVAAQDRTVWPGTS